MSTPTPLITPIPGDPEAVRRVSARLATVESRAREIESRLRSIETGVGPQMWRGQAADGFAALLAGTGPDLTRLVASYGAASQALATYATELAAAQDMARAAEAEATTAVGDRDRATADRDSAEADATRFAAAADEARVRLDPVAAQDADQRRGDALGRANAAGAAVDQAEQALRAAQQKADQAADQRNAAAARCVRELDDASRAGVDGRNLTGDPASAEGPVGAAQTAPHLLSKVGSGFVDFGQDLKNDIWEKRGFNAADVANGVVGGYYAAHRKVLQDEAGHQLREAERFRSRYNGAPGGSELARRMTEQEHNATNRAAELTRRADKMGGFRGNIIAGKIPVIGSLITAAGIAHDINNGKPAGNAIISGVASLGTGIAIGLVLGGAVALPVAVPVAAAAVGGMIFSSTVGVIADNVYDGLPKGTQDAIESGFEAVAEGIGSVWNAIF